MTAVALRPTSSRRDVLAVLQSTDTALSIVDIASRLGLHANTVRYHLRSLAEDGRVEQVRPAHRSPGRPPLMFRAVRGMDRSGPRNYRLLAQVLVAELDDPDRALEAGRAWGRRLTDENTSIADLVTLLAELGFDPELRAAPDAHRIALRHCPFLDLVDEQARVICPVHLGLMQGVTAESEITVEGLEPFAEPDACLAHLGTAGASR